jgi:hypothetical protein
MNSQQKLNSCGFCRCQPICMYCLEHRECPTCKIPVPDSRTKQNLSTISFSTTDPETKEERDYFEATDPDDKTMKNADEIVLKWPIYITNDAESGLYFKINVDEKKGMTRKQLAHKIAKWLEVRNIFFNMKVLVDEGGGDISEQWITTPHRNLKAPGELRESAPHFLVVHDIHETYRIRRSLQVFAIGISS